jgi:Cys-rich repeat protein
MASRWMALSVSIGLLACERQTLELLPRARDAGPPDAPVVAVVDAGPDARGHGGGTEDGQADPTPPGAQCKTEADCQSFSPYCDTTKRCVQCLESSQCPSGQNCDSAVGRCVTTCFDGSDCRQSKSMQCHPERKVCVECFDSSQCDHHDSRICRQSTGECVQCTADDHCPQNFPICDGYRCKQCTTDSDCPAPWPYCDGYACRCLRSETCQILRPDAFCQNGGCWIPIPRQ